MENNNYNQGEESKEPISLFKNSYIWGAYTGVALLLIHYMLYVTGLLLKGGAVGIPIYLILIGGITYGTLQYRKNGMNGFITYGRSFKSCFMISFFASLFVGLFYYLVYYFDANFIEQQIEMAYQQLSEISFVKEKDMEVAIDNLRKQTPFSAFMSNSASYILTGTFLGLLVSIFIKKKDMSFEANFNNEGNQ